MKISALLLAMGVVWGASSLEKVVASDVTIELEQKMETERPPAPPVPVIVTPVPSAQGDQPVEETYGSYDDLDDPFEDKTKQVKEIKDPYEKYNRFMYKVNDKIVQYALDPAARGYRKVVPEKGRVALKNVFSNFAAPVKLVSSIFQKDGDKTERVVKRFAINSTLGIGGINDVANDKYEIEPVSEDFGQTLGTYNVPSGPYLVLPIFGPSTGRDAVGRVVDSFLNPVNYVAPGAATLGMTAGQTINEYSFNVEAKEDLDNSAIDPYESLKHFYNERREQEVKE